LALTFEIDSCFRTFPEIPISPVTYEKAAHMVYAP